MADLTKLKEVFGDELPESHIFFATVANTELPSWAKVRKHFQKTSAIENRRFWLWLKRDYKAAKPPIPPVESITFGAFNANPEVGMTQEVPYIITPESAYQDYPRNFESSDPTVLQFVSDNVAKKTVTVKALKVGPAKLTATVGDKSVSGDFTVKAATVNVTGVTLSPKTQELAPGGTVKLTAAVAPANATNKAVTYKTSDATKATVAADGTVSVPSNATDGTATITVTTTSGAKTDTAVITVKAPVAPEA